MRRSVLLFIFLSFLFVSGPASAGPFGLEMGMSLNQLGPTGTKLGSGYFVITVPKPNPAFWYYAVKSSPTHGVCFIKASGKVVKTNGFGIELQTEFHDMRAKLDSIYGNSILIDNLMPGSKWDDPEKWMMGMITYDRSLSAQWYEVNGTPLNGDIASVFLGTGVVAADLGFVVVEYYFTNNDACEAEIASAEDAA